jgi:hypothetical protein
MLAFFVLPPFLQMGGSATSQDPVAVTWNGGELREGGLERTVAMRSLVNRFLMESAAAGGRDPSRMPLLPEGEEQTVQTTLLAQDAKANGIVVSDQSINDFLGQWTGNLVRQEQFDEILSRRGSEPTYRPTSSSARSFGRSPTTDTSIGERHGPASATLVEGDADLVLPGAFARDLFGELGQLWIDADRDGACVDGTDPAYGFFINNDFEEGPERVTVTAGDPMLTTSTCAEAE